jgi:L-asparaginase
MRKVLLIHTGGTIASAPSEAGLAPAAGVLENAVAALCPNHIRVQVQCFEPLLDSANVTHHHWNQLLDAILAWPGDAVIITHGTDTMAYSGAALAQALGRHGKPVVLTGSMVPLGQGGDAEDNLSLAFFAAEHQSPGVWLAFAGKVQAAAGLVKHHTYAADAFRSVPQTDNHRPSGPRRFGNVAPAVITITPSLSPPALAAMLAAVPAAVLRVYGSGTVCNDAALLDVLAGSVKRGIRLRAVSQSEQGGLEPGAYAAGAALWKLGVENGGNQTPEAALIQLWLEM